MDIILEILIAFGLVSLFMIIIVVVPRYMARKKQERTQSGSTKDK